MDGDKYLQKLILNAKIGNTEDFKKLWKSHKFLLDIVYLNFLKKYPILERRRIEIYHYAYFWFWETIEEHDFLKNDLFCYNLKNKIIKKTMDYLKGNCQIPKELIVNHEEFIKGIKKEKTIKNKKLHYALRSLTAKQLQSIWYYIYENNDLDQSAKKIGIKQRSLRDRLNMSYEKIADISIGIKTKNKKQIFKERIYCLPI